MLVAAAFEESAQQFGGFVLEEALFDGDGVVESAVCGDVMEGSCVTGLGVGGSVDETTNTCGVGGAGAHGARLQGGVEGAAGEAPAAQVCGCLADSEDLGVGGRVICGLALVGGDGQDLGPSGDYGTHGDLALLGGALCGEQGAAHHLQICGGSVFRSSLLAHRTDDSSETKRSVW